MEPLQMLVFVTFCNIVSTKQPLPRSLVEDCSEIREALMIEVADGDYSEYRNWVVENQHLIKEDVQKMIDEAFE